MPPPSIPLAAGPPATPPPLMSFNAVPPLGTGSKSSITSTSTNLPNTSIKESGRALLATPNMSPAIAPITLPPMNVPPPGTAPVPPAALQPPNLGAPPALPPGLPPLNVPPPSITDVLSRPPPSLPPPTLGPSLTQQSGSKPPTLSSVTAPESPVKGPVKTPLLPDPILPKTFNNPIMPPQPLQQAVSPNVPVVSPLLPQPALPPVLPQPTLPPSISQPAISQSSVLSKELPSSSSGNSEEYQISPLQESETAEETVRMQTEMQEMVKVPKEESGGTGPKLEDIPLPHLPFVAPPLEKGRVEDAKSYKYSDEKFYIENLDREDSSNEEKCLEGFSSSEINVSLDAEPAEKSRTYSFSWNKETADGDLSDVTISSVHTSDLSSFEEEGISEVEMEEKNIQNSLPSKEEIISEGNV